MIDKVHIINTDVITYYSLYIKYINTNNTTTTSYLMCALIKAMMNDGWIEVMGYYMGSRVIDNTPEYYITLEPSNKIYFRRKIE